MFRHYTGRYGHVLLAGLVMGAGLMLTPMAYATTTSPTTVKCVIGGKTFTYNAMMSNSSWGSRPDGRAYSPSPVFPIPECPDNHLIMYRSFSKGELSQLKGLIASTDYIAMVGRDTQRYRMAWLEKSLLPQSQEYPWMLLQASWEARDGSEQKARYQAEFVAAAAQVPAQPDKMEWLSLQLRMANAYRELGQFEQAAMALDALPLQKMAEGLPTDEKDIEALSQDKQNAWYFLDFVRGLRVVIARNDRAAEPLDMIPKREAAAHCFFEAETLSVFEMAYCQGADIQKQIEKNHEYWQPAKSERDKQKASETSAQ